MYIIIKKWMNANLFPNQNLKELKNDLMKININERIFVSRIGDFSNKHNVENLGIAPEDIISIIIEAEYE